MWQNTGSSAGEGQVVPRGVTLNVGDIPGEGTLAILYPFQFRGYTGSHCLE